MTKRKSNFFTLAVVSTIVFVLFLTAKYRSNFKFEFKPEYHNQWLSPLKVDNQVSKKSRNTFGMKKPYDYIIENQEVRVQAEMEHFPFKNEQELMDLILDQGGQPKRAMIATTWRSGSTFLGDILLSHPATYYHYEPLINYQIRQIRPNSPWASPAVKAVKKMFNCDYTDLGNYLEYAKVHLETLSHNERLWSHCYGHNRHFCYDPEFLSQFCSLFPFQSMKTVRLRLNLTRELLADPQLNVQVLLLVRDPRATLQSRKHRTWCPGKSDCDQPEKLCGDLVDDYLAAQELKKIFPDRLRVIRYEDFCQDIKSNADSLLDFFGFEMHPRVAYFIESHTHLNKGGVSSTFRDSKNAPYHWRNELSFEEVEIIQQKCNKAMELWGYRQANSAEELEDLQPLTTYEL